MAGKKRSATTAERKARGEFAAVNANTVLLSNQAYDLIKRDIIQCKFRPGHEITENGLTKLYGFGKAPIRAALWRLSQEALINSRPRRGHQVVPITIRNVQEMYELRMILEPAAAVAAISHVDISYLRALCKQLRYTYTPNNSLKFVETHREFHTAIARASGNARLTRIISSLLNDMARLIYFGEFPPDREVGELHSDQKLQQLQHEAIVDALADGKAGLVETVMRDHIRHSFVMVKEALFASRSSVAL